MDVTLEYSLKDAKSSLGKETAGFWMDMGAITEVQMSWNITREQTRP